MQIEKSFVVKAAPDRVWAFLTDPRRVAGSLPGAAITEQIDDREYAGTITVKVGPVSASYRGKVRFERLDSEAREAEIRAFGQDVRGKGGAEMRMTSRVAETAPGETEVTVTSEVSVTGILAQFGRGMIQDVSDELFQRFTEAMRAELESGAETAGGEPGSAEPAAAGPGAAASGQRSAAQPSEAVPIEVLSFGGKVLGRALGRTLRRPAFWAVVLVLALLVYWLWLR